MTAWMWWPSRFQITCEQGDRLRTYQIHNHVGDGGFTYPEVIGATLERLRDKAARDGFDIERAWWRVLTPVA